MARDVDEDRIHALGAEVGREPFEQSAARVLTDFRIRRKEKLNALDAAMIEDIVPLCGSIERSAARVLILTGAGARSFCAGGDIEEWSELTPKDFSQVLAARRARRLRRFGIASAVGWSWPPAPISASRRRM